MHNSVVPFSKSSLFAQLFWSKQASHFRRVGVHFSQQYGRPYIELFRFPKLWFGTLHYDPLSTTELTLWNESCIVREQHHVSQPSSLGIKLLCVIDVEMPLCTHDISDSVMAVWLEKSDAHITFASGMGFGVRK